MDLLGCDKIDTQTSCARTEQEQLASIGIISTVVEFVHLLPTRLLRGATIDSTDLETFERRRPVFLQDKGSAHCRYKIALE